MPEDLPPPPPPPVRLTDISQVCLVGTVVWFLTWAGFLVAHLAAGRPLDVWFGATLCGWLLGLSGYSLFRWQRWAARTGRRGAQRVS